MRWGHATRLPKPPYADSRPRSGVNASILARAPRGNPPPEWSTILAQGLLRPARRSQSCSHTPIRTPVSLHRNLLFAEVLRRPVESALGRPVKPGDDGWECVAFVFTRYANTPRSAKRPRFARKFRPQRAQECRAPSAPAAACVVPFPPR